MPGHKFERITEDIRRELTAILRELKDPRVTQSMISIVKVLQGLCKRYGWIRKG